MFNFSSILYIYLLYIVGQHFLDILYSSFMERNDQLAVLMYLALEENREEHGISIFDV